ALDLPAVANGGFRLLHGGTGIGADRATLVQFTQRADGSGFALVPFASGAVPHHVAFAVLVAHLALPIVDGIAHGRGLAEDRCLAGRLDFLRLAAVFTTSLGVDRHGEQRCEEQRDSRARSPTDFVTHGKKLPRTLLPGPGEVTRFSLMWQR